MTAPTSASSEYDPSIDPLGDLLRDLIREARGVACAVRAPQGAPELLRAYREYIWPRPGGGDFVAEPGEPVRYALLDLVECSGPDAIGPIAHESGECGVGFRQLVESDLRGDEFGFRVEAHGWASWVGRHRLWFGLGCASVALVLAYAVTRQAKPVSVAQPLVADDDAIAEAFPDHPQFSSVLRQTAGSDDALRFILGIPGPVTR